MKSFSSRDKGNDNLIRRRDSRTRDANSEHQRGYLNPKYRAYFAHSLPEPSRRISMIFPPVGIVLPQLAPTLGSIDLLIALASTSENS